MARRMLDDAEINQIAQEIVDMIPPSSDSLQEFLNARGNGQYLFYQCDNLVELTSEALPFDSTSNFTSFSHMFSECDHLVTVPLLNTSNVTSMNGMFSNCIRLANVPFFDTSKVTDMYNMFGAAGQINGFTTVPNFNTENVTNMAHMFAVSGIITVPTFNTSKVTNMSNMFWGCKGVTEIPAFDVSNVTNFKDMFQHAPDITTIHMTGIKADLDISSCTLMEREALVELLNNLGTVTTTQTLTLGSTLLAKLTEDDKAIATNKGWTLA